MYMLRVFFLSLFPSFRVHPALWCTILVNFHVQSPCVYTMYCMCTCTFIPSTCTLYIHVHVVFFVLQNLGHMTGPPVFIGGVYPHIQLNYTDGDNCTDGRPGQKHSTLVSLTCGAGKSVSGVHRSQRRLVLCLYMYICSCAIAE